MLPADPGPGAGTPQREYPPPLDLTDQVDGQPFLCRVGPGFEWHVSEGEMKLIVSFAIPGGPVMWKALDPERSRLLLEWMLKSAEVGG